MTKNRPPVERPVPATPGRAAGARVPGWRSVPADLVARIRRVEARSWLAAGVILAAAAAAVAPTSAPWVEQVYSRRWYLAAQRVVTPVSDLVGFALLDLLLALGVAGLGAWWWRGVGRSEIGRAHV